MYAGLPGVKQTELKGTGPHRLLTFSSFKAKGQLSLPSGKKKEKHSLNLALQTRWEKLFLGKLSLFPEGTQTRPGWTDC